MQNKIVLFTSKLGEEDMDMVRELGYTPLYLDEHNPPANIDEEIPEWSKAEILIGYNPFKWLDISKMKNLKWIQLVSKGIDQVPESVISNSNIAITNNEKLAGIPISEWIIGKIFEIAKKSRSFYEKQSSTVWKAEPDIYELYGKTVGFLGTGNIALETAKRLEAFGMRIIGINRNGHKVEHFHECYERNRMSEVLGKADIVVVTLPDTKENYHCLNENAFAIMKKKAILVNISRGSIIDEEVLLSYLNKGWFTGVALDVFEKEPLDTDNPLWKQQRVIVTPHNAYISENYQNRIFGLIYSNLQRFNEGEQLMHRINWEKGY